MCLADPMYGSNANTSGKASKRGDRTFKGCSPEGKDWDLMASDMEEFDPSPLLAYPEVVIWGANHFCSKLPNATKWIVWDKRDGGNSDDNADCELAWTNLPGPARLYSHLWRGWIRAGEENISCSGAKLHPFQKPVALMRFILSLSKTTGAILVPYMGSGPELVAAKEIGRKVVAFEIEERFCEAAANRLRQGVFAF
jgi:site-specific DNA-methyltransferase (adenine-specific)